MMLSSCDYMRRMKPETLERTIKALQMMKKGATLERAASELNVEKGNLSRDIKQLREEVSFWGSVIDGPLRTERLLEEGNAQKLREQLENLRIKRAEKGLITGGAAPFGCVLKNGVLEEKHGEIKTLREIFRTYLEGKTKAEIAKMFGLSQTKVYTILRDEHYIGKFTLLGKPYQGAWKPIIDPRMFEEVQNRLPATSKRILFGYEWYKKQIRINEKGRKVVDRVVDRFLKEKNIRKIATSEGLPWWIVSNIVRDERRTGKITKSGKLVSSGYPEIVSREKWVEMQRINPSGADFMKQKAIQNQIKVRWCIPAIRAQIIEQTGLCRATVRKIVRKMKEDGELKERADGLLQFTWLPFPENIPILSKTARSRQKDDAIRRMLSEGWLTMKELAEKTGYSYYSIRFHVQKLRPEIERKRTKEGFKLHLKKT